MKPTHQIRRTDRWLGSAPSEPGRPRPRSGRDHRVAAVPATRLAKPRGGMALLMCLVVLSIVTVWLVHMLDSTTIYQSALRNTIEYEQALYLANAGVHHAVAELEADVAWRGTATAGGYPASGSYSATAVDGSVAGTVDVTSYGVSGEVTRTLTATVQVN